MKSGWTARAGALLAAAIAAVLLAGTALAASPTWTLREPPAPAGTTDPALQAVSCASASACVAVGNDTQSGFTEVWDGTTWTTPAFPGQSESGLDAVSCPAASDCTAVGSVADAAQPGTIFPLALHWDGTSWTAQTVPQPAGDQNGILTGISCPSTTHCMAVTNGDYVEVWNGSVWKARPVSAAQSSVSCVSAKFCITVGGDDGSAELWNGSAWTTMTIPVPSGQSYGGFSAVSCGSVSSCTAIGFYESAGVQYPLADHWDGTSWAQQSLPAATHFIALYGVSCARPGRACTLVGRVERTRRDVLLVEHWNGTQWTRDRSVVLPPNSSNALNAVSCHTAVTCVAVGVFTPNHTDTGSLLAEHES
jgi:hypothetical protein